MGTPTGFLDYPRVGPRTRPPLERVRDWSEAHSAHDERTLRRQAARCMDCGVPFCHAGESIAGATAGCPVNNLIPEWNELVRLGKWREASIRLHRTNDFPEFTGRVCPAPCEGSCTVGISGEPVAIKQIEREIVERAWANGWIRPEPSARRTGMRVAIVGSGPAGLAAAARLNRSGHDVTVFERADRIGGLLTYGIPNMKLDKSVVERRVRLMAAEGIRFETGVEAGPDLAAEDLLRFDAVVLATGSTVPRDLRVEGRELAGIHQAMDFLRSNTRSLLDSEHRDRAFVSAAGCDVVVVGGGDTGTDCVATAIRQGARSVLQLEILARPPDERAPDNPWPQWPKLYRLDYGQEEAAALWGSDPRRYAVSTRRFVAGSEGRVAGIELVDVEWTRGEDGRPVPREQPGTEREVPAELVLLALGFAGPEPGLPRALGCALDGRGTVAHDADGMTSVPGVFAAGDCARGQSLVVWAIREGREVAKGVDRYLATLAAS
ncbi:MAG: glutamate synthase subunit beta [Chloroflexi bacterium]|nr:glutamate synthase subunit beta [Chloroflexota bacterium]